MKVGVPAETAAGERRVALVPEVVSRLTAKDFDVLVQQGAGTGALIPDAAFGDAGAELVADGSAVWGADVIVKVAPPRVEEIARRGAGGVLVGFLAPLTSYETTRALVEAKATAFAMEAIP